MPKKTFSIVKPESETKEVKLEDKLKELEQRIIELERDKFNKDWQYKLQNLKNKDGK